MGILTLELIPLVPALGESLKTARKRLYPQTRLMLVWDEHIFRQIPGFREKHDEEAPKPAFEYQPLPEGLKIGAFDVEGDAVFEMEDVAWQMTWAYAKDLKDVRVPRHTSRVNRAVMAYIHQLEDTAEVILRWH